MKKLFFWVVLLGSFYLTQEALARSFCYTVCNRNTCKVTEAQDFCKEHCSDNDTVNCRKQNSKPLGQVSESVRQNACYYGFNRETCKVSIVLKLARKMCKKDEIKNCLKAAAE
jgi:hypothetical protein